MHQPSPRSAAAAAQGSIRRVTDGFREEAGEPNAGDQGAEAGAQHLRRRERGSSHPCLQGWVRARSCVSDLSPKASFFFGCRRSSTLRCYYVMRS